MSDKLIHQHKKDGCGPAGMASAARRGGQVLQEQGDVLQAVTAAISVLEVLDPLSWRPTSSQAPGKPELDTGALCMCHIRMRPSATLAWAPI